MWLGDGESGTASHAAPSDIRELMCFDQSAARHTITRSPNGQGRSGVGTTQTFQSEQKAETHRVIFGLLRGGEVAQLTV